MDPGLIITGIEVTFKLGGILINTFQTWRDAEEELSDRILQIEIAWIATKGQIALLQRVAQELGQEFCRIMDTLIVKLCKKLSAAVTEVQKVAPLGAGGEEQARQSIWAFGQSVDRWQYIRVKSTLSDTIKDLEQWQQRFDRLWPLTVRMNTPSIDVQLQRGIDEQRRDGIVRHKLTPGRKDGQFQSNPLQFAQEMRAALRATPNEQTSLFLDPVNMEKRQLPYSMALIARPHPRSEWLVIDPVPCPPGSDHNTIRANVRHLAHKLRQADPSAFGLLTCKGVVERWDAVTRQTHSFDFVYYIPRGVERLMSLRDRLVHDSGAPSLNRRLAIAQALVKSINHVHIFDFVHKNVRPESVLLFEDAGAQRVSTFLVGFEGFRQADGASAMIGDALWYKDIYRHPERQGEFPAEYYTMQHDIYSLGVCLLEIGLWEPFVCYGDDGGPQIGRQLLALCDWHRQKNRREDWWKGECKNYLTSLARDRLPSAMGERYANVALTCLTCLDEGNDGLGDMRALKDADGVLVGLQFFEKIMMRIDAIII